MSRRSVSGLALHHGGPAVDGGREPAAQRVGFGPSLVDFLDDGRRVLAALAILFQLLEFGGLVDAVGVGALEAQRPLDRDLPVAEGGVVENLALLGLLEVEKSVTDAGDILLTKLAVLLAQVLAQGLIPLRGIDELDLAPAMLRFAVAEYPDVGCDTRVVEQVERQGDDGFQPVVLDDPAADVTLALPSVAGEQGAAVVHLGDAAAERGVLLHLGQLVGQEQHLAVAGTGDQRILGLARMFDHKARVAHVVLAAHALQIGLPALAVGWVGEHEVELTGRESVVGQGRVRRAAHDVVSGFPLRP